MQTLGDVVARERRSDAIALSATGETEEIYTYHRFCTTAWKTGNFLRTLGVRDGSTVVIADDRSPLPVLTVFGTALLGGQSRIGSSGAIDARAVVAPAERVDTYDLPPGGQRVAYGDDHDDPTISRFERSVWSENPSFPPTELNPAAAVLVANEGSYSHRDLLEAATTVVRTLDLVPGDELAVRTPLSDPRTIAAGILGPLVAGSTVVFSDDEYVADAALADRSAPENAVVRLDDVDL